MFTSDVDLDTTMTNVPVFASIDMRKVQIGTGNIDSDGTVEVTFNESPEADFFLGNQEDPETETQSVFVSELMFLGNLMTYVPATDETPAQELPTSDPTG